MKYIIRTTCNYWEDASGWTSTNDVFDEYETSGTREEMESDCAYFDWILERIDWETCDFNREKNTCWVRELVAVNEDDEEVLYREDQWEKELLWDNAPEWCHYNPHRKYYRAGPDLAYHLFSRMPERCLSRATIDRLARENKRDTGESIKSYWHRFSEASRFEINRYGVIND
jgi:hypothetical protein